ncbi:hypothetical protein RchiOBHm_Chr3g0488301 [Rosa chinensis]|uniref:Uncharacterized protein n=1 Tax=Rosa chinensis TaxID=74649 RepID=A0A2P6RFQ6_ROSCH|nr:hypothetical protein RchiOBHm_Chr3g0488301 [Rosa chinensis]
MSEFNRPTTCNEMRMEFIGTHLRIPSEMKTYLDFMLELHLVEVKRRRVFMLFIPI